MKILTGRPVTMGVANMNVRNMLRIYGLYAYELAEFMGISEQTLCRKLRNELPKEQQGELIKNIRELVKNKVGVKNGIVDCC